jgi:hypothetical protein
LKRSLQTGSMMHKGQASCCCMLLQRVECWCHECA